MSLIEKSLAPEESPRMVLGWEEWAALPDLGIYAIKAKIDTGAKTSSLHAFSVEAFGPASRRMVRFGIHPIADNPDIEVYCTAPLVDQREVVSSNGEKELRYIIRSMIRVADRMWPIDISLTNRETMTYRMLIGRQAISDAMIVDPSQSFVQGILSADAYGDVRRRGVRPRHLRIAILTREPENYTNRRLVEEAEKRGHGVDLVNTVRCYMNINADQPEVHYQGEVLPRYDAVIPRVGASITFYGMAVVRQFEMMGTYVLNTAEAIGRSRDKLYAHQLLASNGISMPITGFASSPRDSASLIKFVGGPPVVLKLLEGTQGRGVMLAESKASAEAQIQAFRGLRANILVQQFIGEAAGTDLRLIVIGGRVVAAMRREASQGDWRANLHRGGKAIGIRISSEEREVAVQAARVMGLKVAGVDLLRAKDGPKVLEVNSSPGLEGIEKVSRKNIAGLIIEHIERRAVVRGRHPIAV